MAVEMFPWPTLQERITGCRDPSRYDATDHIFFLNKVWRFNRKVNIIYYIQIPKIYLNIFKYRIDINKIHI